MARLTISPLLALGLAVRTYAAAPYCLPGDACFPSAEVLDEFNSTIGGRLIKSQPYAAACYEATYNAEECKAIAEVKGLHAWRLPQPRKLRTPGTAARMQAS